MSPTDKILPHAPIDTTCEIEHVTSTPHEQPANRTRQSVILRREIQLIQAALMAYETTPSFTCPAIEVKNLQFFDSRPRKSGFGDKNEIKRQEG